MLLLFSPFVLSFIAFVSADVGTCGPGQEECTPLGSSMLQVRNGVRKQELVLEADLDIEKKLSGKTIEKKLSGKTIAGVPVYNYHQAYGGKGSVEFLERREEQEWVVMLKPSASDDEIKEACESSKNGCNLQGHPTEGGLAFLEMRGTEEDLELVIKSNRGVAYAEPDSVVFTIPEEPADQSAATWGLNKIGATQRSSSGSGVTIFVLDTGVRISHDDFGGRAASALDLTTGLLVECNGDVNCAGDRQGHGTHCAGSAGGSTFGVAPSADIRAVKLLSDNGSGRWAWSYSALDWLSMVPIRPAVASMSLGGSGNQQAMKDAVDAAVNSGVVVVVAAGNSNSDACHFSPAFIPSAITVGSTTSLDRRSSFSNYGACVNIWAPGSDVLSLSHASNTGTKALSGTSMACPHVSGAAALILEADPSKRSDHVKQELLARAVVNNLTGLQVTDENAFLWVSGESAPTPPPPPPTPTPTGGSGGWWIKDGAGCVKSTDSGQLCVTSKNWPANYGDNEECVVSLPQGGTLSWYRTVPFSPPEVESGYDNLQMLDGMRTIVASSPGWNSFEGFKEPGTSIVWSSDYSVTQKGWKICCTGACEAST